MVRLNGEAELSHGQEVLILVAKVIGRSVLASIIVLTQVRCMGQNAGDLPVDRDFQPVTSGNGRAITLARANNLSDPRARQVFARAELPIFSGAEVGYNQARDLAILKDTSNQAVLENGHYVAYYWARTLPLGFIDTFRSESTDLKKWSAPSLALAHGLADVDSSYAGVGTVVKFGPTDYRMWYQARATASTSFTTVALATSTDGVTWNKQGVVLKGSDLVSVADLSVPFFYRLSNGKFVLLAEGNGLTETLRKWRVYGFISDDAANWKPINGGQPLLDVGPAGTWDNGHVANPKIMELPDHSIVLEFNGGEVPNSSSAAFQIGFATARSIEGPYTIEPSSPVIGRVTTPPNYGIETSCWILDPTRTRWLHFIQDYPGNSRTSSIYWSPPILDAGMLLQSTRTDTAFLKYTVGPTAFTAFSRSYIVDARDDVTTAPNLLSAYDLASIGPSTARQLQDNRRLMIRRATASTANPGDVTISYFDSGFKEWFWNGTAWVGTTTYLPCDLERPVEARIEDLGTTYHLQVSYADSNGVVGNATVAKSAVMPFSNGRTLVIGDPTTDDCSSELFVTDAAVTRTP